MARNRFLFDLIGIIAYFGSIIPVFLFSNTENAGTFFSWGGGVFGGALLLGFFAFKNDGIKITAIISGLVALGGIVVGVLMIAGAATIFDSTSDLGELIGGLILGPVVIVIGIVLIIAVIIVGGISIGVAAIGSAIGEAVWKDKKDKNFTAVPGQTYVPSKDAYQPTTPTKPQGPGSAVCKQCNASNPGGDKFCINCGAKL
ncbi:MAG: zinc-ribbon domain-containing protein [Candidatus Heimdallarchaeaceae archaeon]